MAGAGGGAATSHTYFEEKEKALDNYADGVTRTLTGQEIAMFRNSEIQAIIRSGQVWHEGFQRWVSRNVYTGIMEGGASSTPISFGGAAAAAGVNTGMVQTSSVQNPEKQKFKKSSERVKKKNRKNREAWRKKKKEKEQQRLKEEEERRLKEEEQRLKEQELQLAETEQPDDESISDNDWKPWHNANHPDALKEDPIELDY